MDTNSNQSQQDGQKPGLSWTQPSPPQNNPVKIHEHPVQNPQPTSASNVQAPTTRRVVTITIVVVVVCALLVWILAGLRNKQPSTAGAAATSSQTGATATGASPATNKAVVGVLAGLSVPSLQDAGLQVAITSASVTVPTWVVVYENHNGQPGNALGAGFFSPEIQSGAVNLLRATLPGQEYFVGESRDDGDRIFSLHGDPVVRDQDGNPVLVQFQTR